MATSGAAVAALLGAPLHGADRPISRPASLQTAGPDALVFVKIWDADIEDRLIDLEPACAIVPTVAAGRCPVPHVATDNPRLAFAEAVNALLAPPPPVGIETTAVIDPAARIGQGVYVGHFAVIEAGVVVGDNTVIGHHTVLRRGVRIGARCRIKPHAVIGGDGFGFEPRADGRQVRLPHLGGVQIGDEVEIGSHTAIASGTLDDTVLADGVKVDDHVFIAHNVQIGPNAMIIAGAEVSGSVEIGAEAWIAPQATILNKIKIGARALVGIGAVVVEDVPEGMVVAGNPARVRRRR